MTKLEKTRLKWTGDERIKKKPDAQRVEGILRRGRLSLGWEDNTKRDMTRSKDREEREDEAK